MPKTDDAQVRQAIADVVKERATYGYRRVWARLRIDGHQINHKRVYRPYTAEGLSIRKRKKTKRIGVRVPLVAALAVNQTWSMDFVSDAINRPGAVSRRIKCLKVADDFSHECVDITSDFGIGGDYVTRLLDRAAMFRGHPKEIRTDNGPEFTWRAFMTWEQKHSIKHILIEPGSPTQNAYIESFNGTFRDECLDENWFESLGAGPPEHCHMANLLQRDQAAQHLRACAACNLRRFASPVNWLCKARQQERCRDQLI